MEFTIDRLRLCVVSALTPIRVPTCTPAELDVFVRELEDRRTARPRVDYCIRASVDNRYFDPYHFACLLSALPCVQSVHTLCLKGHGVWWLKEPELRWLAHALFHPRTNTSTWKRLTLSGSNLGQDTVNVLKQMSSTNKTPLLSATKLAVLMGLNQEKKRKKDGNNSTAVSMPRSCPNLEKLSLANSGSELDPDSLRRCFSHPATLNLRSFAADISDCDLSTLFGVLCDPEAYPAAI